MRLLDLKPFPSAREQSRAMRELGPSKHLSRDEWEARVAEIIAEHRAGREARVAEIIAEHRAAREG